MPINWLGLLQPQDAEKPAQPGGCSRCHPTLGPKPNSLENLTEDDYKNVDCLLCHGPEYKRTVEKVGEKDDGSPVLGFVPAEGVDILTVAQSVKIPDSSMCLRCHAGTGGGPNAKHGVIPTMDSDVHMQNGVECVDCHPFEDHQVPGAADLKAREPVGDAVANIDTDCSNCHEGHESEDMVEGSELMVADVLNEHAEYVACQTCHIPMIARDPNMPTVTYRDYSQPVLNENSGLYMPTNVWEGNLMPEYHWWNGFMESPPEPVGERGDGLISPWKRATYNVPVDAADESPIYVKLGAYFISGNLDVGVAKGVESRQAIDPEYEYSGEYEMAEESMVFSVNHQVAPAAEALACNECHAADGRLDWEALGYDAEETTILASFPPLEPTPEPTEEPTEVPTEEPTEEPTAEPTEEPTPEPEPTEAPAVAEAPEEEPAEEEAEAPAETESAQESGGSNSTTWWIVGGVILVAVIVVAYFLRRRSA